MHKVVARDRTVSPIRIIVTKGKCSQKNLTLSTMHEGGLSHCSFESRVTHTRNFSAIRLNFSWTKNNSKYFPYSTVFKLLSFHDPCTLHAGTSAAITLLFSWARTAMLTTAVYQRIIFGVFYISLTLLWCNAKSATFQSSKAFQFNKFVPKMPFTVRW